MGITEEPYYDFICWTLVGIHREQIKLDPTLFRRMNATLHCFFVSIIFPWVLFVLKEEMHEQTNEASGFYGYCHKQEVHSQYGAV